MNEHRTERTKAALTFLQQKLSAVITEGSLQADGTFLLFLLFLFIFLFLEFLSRSFPRQKTLDFKLLLILFFSCSKITSG